MGNATKIAYEAQLIRNSSPDYFLLSLFVPAETRGLLQVLYAFDAELAHVHHAVTEEINAHIRYAWWQESLDQIHEGKTPRAHPVVQSLAAMIKSGQLEYASLARLVEAYREAFPEMPGQSKKLVEEMAVKLLMHVEPQALKGWGAALRVIDKHRERYGRRRNFALHVKLMLLGVR